MLIETGEGQIPDEDRMDEEEMRLAGVGLSGPARWRKVGRVAEERAYRLGWESRSKEIEDAAIAVAAAMDSIAVAEIPSLAAEEPEDVKCPTCNGSGKMWGYGDQCKRCYGKTTVPRDRLTEDELQVAGRTRQVAEVMDAGQESGSNSD